MRASSFSLGQTRVLPFSFLIAPFERTSVQGIPSAPNVDRAVEIYKERFADFSDFTFVFVGNIAEENVTVEVVNILGQIVFQGKVQSPNTTYIVPLNVASGEYFVSLSNENERLEVEKLIVK